MKTNGFIVLETTVFSRERLLGGYGMCAFGLKDDRVQPNLREPNALAPTKCGYEGRVFCKQCATKQKTPWKGGAVARLNVPEDFAIGMKAGNCTRMQASASPKNHYSEDHFPKNHSPKNQCPKNHYQRHQPEA